MASLDYSKAGVDRERGDLLVEKIIKLSRPTLNPRVKTPIGGYASLYALNSKTYLASATDGVGTKLKLAFRLGRHDTIGIDLVAMSVNDLLCVGAEPLFFLDYFATGKILPKTSEKVIAGIIKGCALSDCALIGGETAEMPGIYSKGEYDLAGFAVGTVAAKNVLPRKDIRPGDRLIGLASSGFHSNGFSLLRKLIPAGKKGDVLAKKLLNPTAIYKKALWPLIQKRTIKGLAHITGSGFLNLPRVSDRVSYELSLPHPLAKEFQWVKKASGLPMKELLQTFNMGVGMVAVVDPKKVSLVKKQFKRVGRKCFDLGEVVRSNRKNQCRVTVHSQGEQSTVLEY